MSPLQETVVVLAQTLFPPYLHLFENSKHNKVIGIDIDFSK